MYISFLQTKTGKIPKLRIRLCLLWVSYDRRHYIIEHVKRIFPLALVFIFGLGPVLFFVWFSGSLTPAVIGETRAMTPLEQSAQALAGLGIKPLYSLLSLALIALLAGQAARDLTALRWGLVAFLTGETFCAINFWIFQHESLLSEYLHSYGMVLAFGLTAFAVLDGLDARLLKINQPESRCAVAGLCGVCKRTAPLQCAARRSAQIVVVMSVILAFLPLMAPLRPQAYATSIYGFPYSYTRFPLYEWYEDRALPFLALACFVLAFLPLLRKGGLPIPMATKVFFCAGLGALGFAFFRLGLRSIFSQELVWFEFWEETTELMYIAGVGLFLWQFRHILNRVAVVQWLLGEKE